jgi:hypothetical protein
MKACLMQGIQICEISSQSYVENEILSLSVKLNSTKGNFSASILVLDSDNESFHSGCLSKLQSPNKN